MYSVKYSKYLNQCDMTYVIHIETRYRILVVEISRKCLATYTKKRKNS